MEQRVIKFREWTGKAFHYFGFVEEGVFKGPTMVSRGTEFIQQFTGLKAKNGDEVFEGDWVRYGTPYHGKIETILTGKVVWNNYCGSFQIAYPNIYDEFVTDFIHQFTILQVIGNIFENPKLVK